MRRATAVLLLLCTTCPLLAQERVAAVVFAGLEKTDPEYLRRFVRTRTGAPYDSLQVGRDVQALRNLRLFLDVTAATTAADDGRRVTFHCREVLTLLPILNFGGIQGNGWGSTSAYAPSAV